MTPEAVILTIIGLIVTLLGSLLVFRRNTSDSIDRKRESELQRLDDRVEELSADLRAVTADLAVVKRDGRIVAAVAIRAVRVLESSGIADFHVTQEERDAIERTRPVV